MHNVYEQTIDLSKSDWTEDYISEQNECMT